MRSLLNNFSTLEILLFFVGGATVIAVVGAVLAERVFPNLRDGSFESASTEVQTTFTLLFGLILALTITGLSDNSDAADSAVSREASTLAKMTRASQAFPLGERIRQRAAIDQYVHAVAEDEFATMKNGRPSPIAAAALANLYSVVNQSTASVQKVAPGGYSSTRLNLDELTAIRRDRLQISSESLSPLFRSMLLIGTILFIVLAYPVKITERGPRLVVMGGVAAFITFVFVLTIVLDYPFSGELSTSNQSYKEAALAAYWPAI